MTENVSLVNSMIDAANPRDKDGQDIIVELVANIK